MNLIARFLAVLLPLALLAPVADAATPAGEATKTARNGGAVKRKVATVVAKRKRAAPATPVATVPSFGQVAGLHRKADPLELKSSVALVVDQETREVLFRKNDHAVLPIASLTKLMTGLLINEANLDMNEPIQITQEDVDTEKGSRSRLKVGTELTRGELMHLALMSSENRAAHALGRTYPGGTVAFVQAMNAKAQLLGLHNAKFVDPTGLAPGNVASPQDLALLVSAASTFPQIREFSTAQQLHVTLASGGRSMGFNNTNVLVRSEGWHIGLSKTGFINEAGKCLVMHATIANNPVVIVLLDSWGKLTRVGDANRIKRWLETQKIAAISAKHG